MTRTINVILVTGFLGSGKTTFLNHAIRAFPAGIKVAVLMNEFADIGIDATLLTRRENLDVIEVNKGSIFCVCAKKDFLLGLAQIAEQIAPDVLLIEATGVANPLDIKKDLALSVFNGRFEFASQICLIDTPNFEAAYHVYNAVENQIASSDLFVLNKLDLTNPAEKQTARELIAAHRTSPVFLEAVNARVPFERFMDRWGLVPGGAGNASEPEKIPRQSVERAAAGGNPTDAQRPADPIVAAVYLWKGRNREQMTALLETLPATVLRAKGFVRIDGGTCLLNRVMGTSRIEPLKPATAVSQTLHNRIVFVAPPEAFDALEQSAASHLLEKEARHDPMEIMAKMPAIC